MSEQVCRSENWMQSCRSHSKRSNLLLLSLLMLLEVYYSTRFYPDLFCDILFFNSRNWSVYLNSNIFLECKSRRSPKCMYSASSVAYIAVKNCLSKYKMDVFCSVAVSWKSIVWLGIEQHKNVAFSSYFEKWHLTL